MTVHEFFCDKTVDEHVTVVGARRHDVSGATRLFTVSMQADAAEYCFGHCQIVSENYEEYIHKRDVLNMKPWENTLCVRIEIPRMCKE